jgi:putative transposase
MGEPPRLEAKPSGSSRYCRGMMEYRRSSHAVFRLRYHFVFSTRCRNPVLKGDITKETRKMAKEICRTHDIEIVKGHIRPEHIHVLLDVPPKMSPGKVMQAIKQKTSHYMLQESRRLRRECWGLHLWVRGYCVATNLPEIGGTNRAAAAQGATISRPADPDALARPVRASTWTV